MKYDKDTMNSLQEAYASVNEVKYYSGKDRNKKTGTPKKLQNQTSTTSNKKPKGSMPTGGDGTAYMGEEKVSKDHPNHPDKHEDHPEMTYKDAAKIRGEKKTAKKQVELGIKSKFTDKYYPEKEGLKPAVANKKVAFKRKRIDEAIKMTKKEYAKTHKDFKSDDKKNPRVTRYVPGKGTVSTPVELTDQVDKKKEMEDKMKEVEDMRSLPTRMNLIKTKLRAMGLNMSHVLKGKELSEVIDYALDEATRYKKEMGYDVGGTKKPTSPKTPDPALDAVKAKYKGQIMRSGSNQPKKVKGAKSTVGTNKYKDMADKKKETAADAKKRGFDNVQSYVDAMARYGGKKNYDQGKGLGS
jgi:hypothetical protein